MDTNEIRHITQMAYLSWPDHGVPDSNEEFVDFVEKVRTCRQGYSLCPTVVHCSAGKSKQLVRLNILLSLLICTCIFVVVLPFLHQVGIKDPLKYISLLSLVFTNPIVTFTHHIMNNSPIAKSIPKHLLHLLR